MSHHCMTRRVRWVVQRQHSAKSVFFMHARVCYPVRRLGFGMDQKINNDAFFAYSELDQGWGFRALVSVAGWDRPISIFFQIDQFRIIE